MLQGWVVASGTARGVTRFTGKCSQWTIVTEGNDWAGLASTVTSHAGDFPRRFAQCVQQRSGDLSDLKHWALDAGWNSIPVSGEPVRVLVVCDEYPHSSPGWKLLQMRRGSVMVVDSVAL